MNFLNQHFVNERILWTIPIVLAGVIWFFWRSWRTRQALVRRFISERLLPQLLEGLSPGRQKIKMALLAFAVLFLMLALARPQWGFSWQEASQRGRDILVAIDTSRSMLAEDMAPNRLARAKLAALDLLRLSKSDRLGLIAFAGSAFLQCPLTLDEEAFRQNIDALDTTIIPQGGTAVTEAIDTAVTSFAAEEGDNHKVLIIFTDGEDHEKGAIDAAQKAADHHVKIFTVGVGSPAGEVVRITDENGKPAFLRDSEGNVVKSRLDEDLLRQIATTGNGFYVSLREGNAMKVLYERGLEPLPTSEVTSKLVRQLNEQYHWPLGIAIALLLAEALLPSTSKKKTAAAAPAKSAKPVTVAAALLLMFCQTLQASPSGAYRDYKQGNYKDARNEYERLLEKKPDDARLRFNAGAAAYKAGEFDAAVKNFENASRAQDLKLQEAAYYNMGNANYKLGAGQMEPDKKMAVWQEAIQNYEAALKLNANDADAAFNRELVKKQLEELKKQQQQKNQDKNDNKDQNKDDKNQDSKDQKDQQKQDKKENKDNKDQKNQDQQEKKDNQDSKSEQQKKQEEEKRRQEEQKQSQQQQQEQKGEQGKEGEQQEKNRAEQKPEDQQKSEAEAEARAAQLAQMTPKQAQQLLDAQKSEERALIYRQPQDPKKARPRVFKDW